MRVKFSILVILTYCGLMFAQTTNAQTNPIKVRFRVDRKEIQQPFRIEISLNGFVLKPKVDNNSFYYPPELSNVEQVNLRFISGKYKLDFKNIPLKKFNDLVISVDNRPFEKENLPEELSPDKELVFIYSISYGTVELIHHVYK